MSLAGCWRLCLLGFWLVTGGVDCENTQKGYVLRVHNDKRWREPSNSRSPTLSLDREEGRTIDPAEGRYHVDSPPAGIRNFNPYPVIPEAQNKVPKTPNRFDSGFRSAPVTHGGRSIVWYNPSGNQAKGFPDGKRIHRPGTDSPSSIGAVQSQSGVHRVRTKWTEAPAGFGSDHKKASVYSPSRPEQHSPPELSHLRQESRLKTRPGVDGYVFQDRSRPPPRVLKPVGRKTGSTIKEHATGPRVYSGDVAHEARGYAQVRWLRPGLGKAPHRLSSAPERRFLTSFPQGSYGPGERDLGFGPSSPAGESGPNLNKKAPGVDSNCPRGIEPASWHPLPTASPALVQGKFKPFQTLNLTSDIPPGHTSPSDTEMGPGHAVTETPHSLNVTSRGISSTDMPLVTGESSTESASPSPAPMQTEALTQASVNLHEDQSGGQAEVTTPEPRPEDDDEKSQGDIVSSP